MSEWVIDRSEVRRELEGDGLGDGIEWNGMEGKGSKTIETVGRDNVYNTGRMLSNPPHECVVVSFSVVKDFKTHSVQID